MRRLDFRRTLKRHVVSFGGRTSGEPTILNNAAADQNVFIQKPLFEEQAMEHLDRITQQPEMMGGKPCIRGMRVTVGMIVGQVGAGRSVDEVLADFPYLEREDIMQALRYAAWRSEEREVVLVTA